ncbi:MAG TPA: hypothetical protein VJT73_06010 [Polyangiaceae bacterium]|nr:hypothetical protein [Polyangiaceae bacterium]
MAATHFRIVGEPSTDELGRIAIHVEVSPPGEIVDVSWSPVGAHASAGYGGWGCAELAVLRRAIDEASRYMHEHPEKRALLRAGLRST